jgi:hypothetical protein
MVRLNVLSFLLSLGTVSSFNTRTLKLDEDFNANSQAGKDLISSSTLVNGSRSLEDGYEDYDFMGKYSIKFLDCHSVSQWDGEHEDNDNDSGDEEEEEEGNNHIVATNLIRFRLCPANSCQHKSNAGCSSKYGDYLVDMNTFVYNYLKALDDLNDDINDWCYTECLYDDDSCMESCFKSNGGYTREAYDDDGVNFDPLDYAQCSAFEDDYYIGPHCSSDGKSVNLALFSNNKCTAFASCDSSCFYSTYGYYLPYTDTSVVSKGCVSCAYNYLSQRYDGNSYDKGASETCKNMYTSSGKCETKLSISYPNESACTYIEGIKFLQKDGVISSNSVKKSKGASVAIGFISFGSILLAVYVHYLSTKLYRAKFNLSSSRAVL